MILLAFLALIVILLFCTIGAINRAALSPEEKRHRQKVKWILGLGAVVAFAYYYGSDPQPVAETVQAHAFPFPARKP